MSEALDRAAVIEAMCLTWRHDFGLDRINDALLVGCGMSEGEREFLRREMEQLFDHHFAPAVAAAIEIERQACLETVKSHGPSHPKIQHVVADLEKRFVNDGESVSAPNPA